MVFEQDYFLESESVEDLDVTASILLPCWKAGSQ